MKTLNPRIGAMQSENKKIINSGLGTQEYEDNNVEGTQTLKYRNHAQETRNTTIGATEKAQFQIGTQKCDHRNVEETKCDSGGGHACGHTKQTGHGDVEA